MLAGVGARGGRLTAGETQQAASDWLAPRSTRTVTSALLQVLNLINFDKDQLYEGRSAQRWALVYAYSGCTITWHGTVQSDIGEVGVGAWGWYQGSGEVVYGRWCPKRVRGTGQAGQTSLAGCARQGRSRGSICVYRTTRVWDRRCSDTSAIIALRLAPIRPSRQHYAHLLVRFTPPPLPRRRPPYLLRCAQVHLHMPPLPLRRRVVSTATLVGGVPPCRPLPLGPLAPSLSPLGAPPVPPRTTRPLPVPCTPPPRTPLP